MNDLLHTYLINYGFIFRAAMIGIAICIVAGPLGSLILWRRMSYFGDTLAHATLLGISFAVLLGCNIYLGLISVCLILAIILAWLGKTKDLSNDTLLSILSPTTLALGLIITTKIQNNRIDLLSYLYGDILAVNYQDIGWVLVIVLLVLIMLCKLWPALLAITIHEDLAKVEGVAVERIKLLFIMIMALVFAIAMKIIGVLLLTALFVIPAATARKFARSPEMMALFASIFGVIAIVFGLLLSLLYDLPAGPAIVITAAGCFGLVSFKSP